MCCDFRSRTTHRNLSRLSKIHKLLYDKFHLNIFKLTSCSWKLSFVLIYLSQKKFSIGNSFMIMFIITYSDVICFWFVIMTSSVLTSRSVYYIFVSGVILHLWQLNSDSKWITDILQCKIIQGEWKFQYFFHTHIIYRI